MHLAPFYVTEHNLHKHTSHVCCDYALPANLRSDISDQLLLPMASSDQSCIALLCGGCCVFLFSALEPWCNSKRYGCGCCICSCGGPRGFCGSCFDTGFNKDAWDEEDAQRTVEASANAKEESPDMGPLGPDAIADQPAAVAEMKPTTAHAQATSESS
ncbi:hypothetical protein K439DRAFT_659977 [Ramaria rubella]|nr:hypothetical protein K439DRAFT_659977 [Ramaria rubella]